MEFAVQFYSVDCDTFQVTDEMVMTAIMCADITNARSGCLLVLHSGETCVIHSVSRNFEVAEKCINFLRSYLSEDKCLTRKSLQMNEKISSIRVDVERATASVIVLGSYPTVKTVINCEVQTSEDASASQSLNTSQQCGLRDTLTMKKDLMRFLELS